MLVMQLLAVTVVAVVLVELVVSTLFNDDVEEFRSFWTKAVVAIVVCVLSTSVDIVTMFLSFVSQFNDYV